MINILAIKFALRAKCEAGPQARERLLRGAEMEVRSHVGTQKAAGPDR